MDNSTVKIGIINVPLSITDGTTRMKISKDIEDLYNTITNMT